MAVIIRLPYIRAGVAALSAAMNDGGLNHHEQLVVARLLARLLANADATLERDNGEFGSMLESYLGEEVAIAIL